MLGDMLGKVKERWRMKCGERLTESGFTPDIKCVRGRHGEDALLPVRDNEALGRDTSLVGELCEEVRKGFVLAFKYEFQRKEREERMLTLVISCPYILVEAVSSSGCGMSRTLMLTLVDGCGLLPPEAAICAAFLHAAASIAASSGGSSSRSESSSSLS